MMDRRVFRRWPNASFLCTEGMTVAEETRIASATGAAAAAEVAKRILVVEDELEMLYLIERKLAHAGYRVETADSAPRALERIARSGLPHLAIVDINLPGMSGLEFCETVQQYCDLPVILVTAVNEGATRVTAIEKYAEDYIIKPFNLDELVARVQRLLRRIGDFSYALGPEVRIDGRLKVNFICKQLIVDGAPVDLTPTETKLLYILWRNANQIITNDFLINRVWPDQDIYDDTLRVHVHRLRQKMAAGAHKKQYIVTERNRGYRFVMSKGDGR
jgi:DNA-binding response OmpR family regulator